MTNVLYKLLFIDSLLKGEGNVFLNVDSEFSFIIIKN